MPTWTKVLLVPMTFYPLPTSPVLNPQVFLMQMLDWDGDHIEDIFFCTSDYDSATSRTTYFVSYMKRTTSSVGPSPTVLRTGMRVVALLRSSDFLPNDGIEDVFLLSTLIPNSTVAVARGSLSSGFGSQVSTVFSSTLALGDTVALIDLNNDRALDLYFGRSALLGTQSETAGPLVFLTGHGGSSTDPSYPSYAVDLDGDGLNDIFHLGFALLPQVALHNGTWLGSRAAISNLVPSGITASALANADFLSSTFFDYDEDGDLDILSFTSSGLFLLLNAPCAILNASRDSLVDPALTPALAIVGRGTAYAQQRNYTCPPRSIVAPGHQLGRTCLRNNTWWPSAVQPVCLVDPACLTVAGATVQALTDPVRLGLPVKLRVRTVQWCFGRVVRVQHVASLTFVDLTSVTSDDISAYDVSFSLALNHSLGSHSWNVTLDGRPLENLVTLSVLPGLAVPARTRVELPDTSLRIGAPGYSVNVTLVDAAGNTGAFGLVQLQLFVGSFSVSPFVSNTPTGVTLKFSIDTSGLYTMQLFVSAVAVTNATFLEASIFCPAGTRIGSSAVDASCEPCQPGSYQNATSSVLCISCPPGSSSPEGAGALDQCTCLAGWYFDMLAGGCLACPPGAHCDGGRASPVALPGFAVVGSNFAACMQAAACPGSRNASLAACSPAYEGPLCKNCAPGYAQRKTGACYACKQTRARGLLGLFVLVLVLLAGCVVWLVLAGVSLPLVESAVGTLQVLALLGRLNMDWPEHARLSLSVLGVFSLESDLFVRCAVGFPMAYAIGVLAPVAFAVLVFVGLAIGTRVCVRQQRTLAQLTLASVLLVAPTAYLPIARSVLELFDCTHIPALPGRSYFVSADLRMECGASEWRRLLVLGTVGLVYVIGIPLALGSLAMRRSAFSNDRASARLMHGFFTPYRIASSTPFAVALWLVIELLRKLVIVILCLFLSRYRGIQLMSLLACTLGALLAHRELHPHDSPLQAKLWPILLGMESALVCLGLTSLAAAADADAASKVSLTRRATNGAVICLALLALALLCVCAFVDGVETRRAAQNDVESDALKRATAVARQIDRARDDLFEAAVVLATLRGIAARRGAPDRASKGGAVNGGAVDASSAVSRPSTFDEQASSTIAASNNSSS